MVHDYGLLTLAIESILADCGRMGLLWDELPPDASPDCPPSLDLLDSSPSPPAEWSHSTRAVASEAGPRRRVGPSDGRVIFSPNS